MQHLSGLSPLARDIFALARQNKKSAEAALGKLSLAEQVALICEAPLSRRAELLELAPLPEAIIPELPEAELVFIVKAVGLADATWILEYATPEQFVACVGPCAALARPARSWFPACCIPDTAPA